VTIHNVQHTVVDAGCGCAFRSQRGDESTVLVRHLFQHELVLVVKRHTPEPVFLIVQAVFVARAVIVVVLLNQKIKIFGKRVTVRFLQANVSTLECSKRSRMRLWRWDAPLALASPVAPSHGAYIL